MYWKHRDKDDNAESEPQGEQNDSRPTAIESDAEENYSEPRLLSDFWWRQKENYVFIY